jgi:hypothetical protein
VKGQFFLWFRYVVCKIGRAVFDALFAAVGVVNALFSILGFSHA